MIHPVSPTHSSSIQPLQNLFQGENATSHKVNSYVILQGLLFAIGAACIIALFLVPQIPQIALVAGAAISAASAFFFRLSPHSSKVDTAQSAPELIPGQPVGIYRQGNNCWLISLLQLLCNVPAYQKQMEALNPRGFYDPLKEAYHQYQMDRKKEGPSSLDNRALRERLHAAHPKPPFSADSNSEEDPWDILSKFCSDVDLHFELFDVCNVRDLQAHYSVWCPAETTQEFTVNMIRADAEVRLDHKIKNPLHLETRVGNFDCDGFIVHQGVTVDSGHYVAYVKRVGYWWEINDNTVRRLSNQEASTLAENGTIFHFQK